MQSGKGRLVICPTPLGNLGDMTKRAHEALSLADAILAEDTRVTGKLLSALGIKNSLERLDENMIAQKTQETIARIASGEVLAYCTDAGMPGVSDPGLRLVAAVREAGLEVEVLPGPSAAVTAYVASGTHNANYYFGGFFPRKDAERIRLLQQLGNLDAALVFYESPKRIVSALHLIAQQLPSRKVAVCRELTKLHEEVVCDRAPQLAEEFAKRSEEGVIRGEIVLVIDGPTDEEREGAADQVQASAMERAQELLASGTYTNKDIVEALRAEFGISRNKAYAIVHG